MLKYICTKDSVGRLEIFSFPKSIAHDAMAEVLVGIKNQTTGDWRRIHRTPVSAGFISKDGVCFGRSFTLNLEAEEERDTTLLKEQMKH